MRRPRFLIAGYGALAAAVAGPLLAAGLILAVDAAPVPRAHLDPSYWGLGQGTHEGTLARLPLDALLAGLGWLTSVAFAQKLVLLAAIMLAGLGMHRLVEVRHPAARLFAGLLYAVNPFVYERIWTGQLYLLLGYALLPWAFAAFRGLIRRDSATVWRFVALGLITGIASAHMALLLALLCGFVLLAAGAGGSAPSLGLRRGWLALGLAAVASAWWLLPTPGVSALWSHVGHTQLSLYASVGDPHWGLIPTLAALSGYWNDATPAVSHVPGWPALTLTLFMLCAGGAWLRRRDRVVWGVLAAGLAGFVLALGYAWGPTRAPFAWLLAHVPPLRSFRESGKGLALVAFAYAYAGSVAVDDLVEHVSVRRRSRFAVAALLLAVPLVLGARQLWGEWGQLHTSRYPSAWARANSYLDRVGQGSRTLVLPFHGYFALTFAHHRLVANPAASYFGAPTLVGRSVGGPEDQTDPEQTAVQQLLASPATRGDFTACLAALGVGRILVLHQADWQSYGDLARRPGIAVERSWPGVTLYRSDRPASLVMARTAAGHGCRDWTPVPARRAGPFRVRLLAPAPAGVAMRVEMPDAARWQPSGSGAFRYAGWSTYRRNYIVGAALLLLVVLACAWPLRRRGLTRLRQPPMMQSKCAAPERAEPERPEPERQPPVTVG
ncbi:MAG: hypothetical protein ACJ76X_19845 [Solirubrobacteraceae bacterium]